MTPLMLVAALTAAQQEYVGPEDGMHVHRPETSIVVSGRFTDISGSADDDVNFDLGYGDIFGTGTGIEIEGRLLWETNDFGWLVGGYLALAHDSFDGATDVDSFGDSLETDGMEVSSLIIGFKGVHYFQPAFHFSAQAGVGFVSYDTVDGTLIVGGGPPTPVEVFTSSTAGAFDLGAHMGFGSENLFFELGLTLRIQGAPEEGDFNFNSRAAAVAGIEIGAGLRF